MSAITFPNSPSAGAQITRNGITYTFTDGTWIAVGQSNFYTLPTATAQVLGGVKGGGTDITIANDGVISFSGTIPGDFTGATSGADGTTGLVIKPSAGDEGKYLKGDGTWDTVIGGEVTVQNSGVDLATAATTINFDGAGVTATGTGAVKTITIPGGSGGINDIVEDTTPQLGGDLDTNGHAIFDENNINLAVPNSSSTVVSVSSIAVQYFQKILLENSKNLNIVGGNLNMAVATGGSSAGNINILGGVTDKDGQLGNPGQVLSSTGTQVDWIDSAGASSETIYQGSMSKEMDPNIPDGYGHGINLGQTGYTDTTTYPQQMPTYSDSSAGNGTGILNAFDGDEDTYSNLTPPTTGGWSKISFTNPLGLRTDGTKEITRITIGFDGTGKFGYNGGNTTTIGTGLAGTVQEIVLADIDLLANPGTAIQLDDLYFESVSGTDELRLHYVIIDTNDSGHGGGTKLTIEKHELGWNKLPTTGKNFGFYLHDDGDIWRNPEGLGFRITPSLANATIGVKTDQPRWLVLPLGSKCTLGDTITILDLGMGRERRDSGNSYRDSATTSGNAGSVPILIYPASEDGIQGTHRVSASDLSTFSYSGPLKTTGILAPEPFHGTPLAITENGESIKLMWCGIEYGWRYLP